MIQTHDYNKIIWKQPCLKTKMTMFFCHHTVSIKIISCIVNCLKRIYLSSKGCSKSLRTLFFKNGFFKLFYCNHEFESWNKIFSISIFWGKFEYHIHFLWKFIERSKIDFSHFFQKLIKCIKFFICSIFDKKPRTF